MNKKSLNLVALICLVIATAYASYKALEVLESDGFAFDWEEDE